MSTDYENKVMKRPVKTIGTIEYNISIYPARSDNIVIHLPGFNAAREGFRDKYRKIASLIRNKGVGAVIISENKDHKGAYLPFSEISTGNLRHLVSYAIRYSKDICGADRPNIFLSGYSAGGGTVASVCWEFTEIRKVLLIAPAADVGEFKMLSGLGRYIGEVYIAVGEEDRMKNLALKLHRFASSAIAKRITVVPDCGHGFRGKTNGIILGNSFLWAFGDGDEFPALREGAVLY